MPDEPTDLHESVMETEADAAPDVEEIEDWTAEVEEANFDYLHEVSGGEINDAEDGERFQKQLQTWLCKQSEDAACVVILRMRNIILEAAGRQGIVETKDLPEPIQSTLSELSLSLAGHHIKAVNTRITKELRHLRAAQRIPFYDQVIEDLTLAETYALDAQPPERAGFLKLARSLRGDCHRACQALRRHHRA
ncbi:MAG: hypothetical protein ABL974_21070 [Prosthecobacter sp.]